MLENGLAIFRFGVVACVILALVMGQYDIVWWLIIGGAILSLGASLMKRRKRVKPEN